MGSYKWDISRVAIYIYIYIYIYIFFSFFFLGGGGTYNPHITTNEPPSRLGSGSHIERLV